MVCHWKSIRLCCAVGFAVGWGVGVQGWGGGASGRVVLIDNGRVYQSKAADALVQVKTTKFGTNVGLNMLLNISSRYFGGLFWSRQLRGLPSSDGYFFSWDQAAPGRIMPWRCPSVRPSVRPSFPDFFWTCFEISIWNLVYAFSGWHDMSSLSLITIVSLWSSLQPKVGQTQFLQSWPYKSR